MFSKFLILFFCLGIFSSSVIGASSGWSAVRPYRDALVSQLGVVNAAIDAVPATGGTAEQALTVVSVLDNASKSYDAAAKIYSATLASAGPPAQIDTVDGCGNNTVGPMLDVISALSTKKDAFTATGSTDQIKSAITNLNSSSTAFHLVWLSIAPEGFTHLPESGKTAIDAAFTRLFTEYV